MVLLNLFPNLSFHVIYSHSIKEALIKAKSAHFQGIQLAIEAPHLFQELQTPSHLEEIDNTASLNQKYIILHGYDDLTSLYCIDSELNQGILNHYRTLFSIARKLHSPLLTIHLGKLPTYPIKYPKRQQQTLPKIDQNLYVEALTKNLASVLSNKPPGLPLAIENYGFFPALYPALEPFLRNPEIGLCWDFPKMMTKRGEIDEQMLNFYRAHATKIFQIHLHDYDPAIGGHLPLGQGMLNYMKYLQEFPMPHLLDVCFEIRPFDQAEKSQKRFRHQLDLPIK